ncbi:MAG: hypothetical protein WC570_01790 [Patescibacteria group bacterium]
MDLLFAITLIVYALLMLVLLVFNVMAIRHILRYRFKGDVSMGVLLGYVLVIAVLVLVTTFSLMALGVSSFIGGGV